MASKQSYIGRNVSQLARWLAVPRGITLLVLVITGLSTGLLLWHFVDSVKVLSWISGMATPFCMMCATVVWAMRERLDEAFDTDQMTSREYKQLVNLSSKHRARSTHWSAVTGLMALVSSTPAVSNQLIGPVWSWMIVATGCAVAISIYAYLLANYWDHQMREYKIKQKIEGKRQAEQKELLEGLNQSQPLKSGTGWVEGPDLIDPVALHH